MLTMIIFGRFAFTFCNQVAIFYTHIHEAMQMLQIAYVYTSISLSPLPHLLSHYLSFALRYMQFPCMFNMINFCNNSIGITRQQQLFHHALHAQWQHRARVATKLTKNLAYRNFLDT